MLWNSLEPLVVSSNPPMCVSCIYVFINLFYVALNCTNLVTFVKRPFSKSMEDLLRGYQPIQESPKKILCWWMGGLEIKEVWRPPTSCNLFITSFTFRPCLPLVRGCIWLSTGSTRNHRRKQDNKSPKKKAIKACFFARVCLLISSRAIYEMCLWLLHTSSWATADGGNRKQTWARQETFVSGQRSGGWP